jgi:hypothetical protein
MNPTPGCPILRDTNNIQGLAHDLTRAFRRLRRDLVKCQLCDNFEDCPTLKDLNSVIDSTITEISEEWNKATLNHQIEQGSIGV